MQSDFQTVHFFYLAESMQIQEHMYGKLNADTGCNKALDNK